jgi:hypothetical protein
MKHGTAKLSEMLGKKESLRVEKRPGGECVSAALVGEVKEFPLGCIPGTASKPSFKAVVVNESGGPDTSFGGRSVSSFDPGAQV